MIIIKSTCLLFIIYTFLKNIKKLYKKSHLLTNQEIFETNKTIIQSHRGINREILENTMESFIKALDYGVESIETDVWLSKDNVLVIFHGFGENGQISGLFDGVANITQTKWSHLSSYRTLWGNMKMPTLEEVFKLTKNKIYLNLEIKDPRIDLLWPVLIKLIEKYDFFEQITLSSFFYEYYNKTNKYNLLNNKRIPFGFLYHRNDTNPFIFDKKGNSLNMYYTDATKKVCDKAHENGMTVLVWFEMIDEENFDVYKKLIDNGVNIICSNEPALAKRFLEKYYFQFYRKKRRRN